MADDPGFIGHAVWVYNIQPNFHNGPQIIKKLLHRSDKFQLGKSRLTIKLPYTAQERELVVLKKNLQPFVKKKKIRPYVKISADCNVFC